MGLCETKEKEKNLNMKLHMSLKINQENNDALFNCKNSSYQKKLNYVITKNSILYIDTNDYNSYPNFGKSPNTIEDKIFFKEKIINNNFTKYLKKIQFNFDREKKRILLNYIDEEKTNYKNFLWQKKIRTYLKEMLKIEALPEDYFRIGRYIFKIIKINKKKENKNLKIKKIEKIKRIENRNLNNDNNLKECRICLEEEEEKNNIFAKNICDCSEKYPVHIKCLLIWLQKKCCKKLRNKQILYYDLTALKCDLCLKNYPEKIFYKKKKKNIFEIKMDLQKDFILLEISEINFKKKKKKIFENKTKIKKGIYYIEPENNEYKFFSIGSNENSLIKIEDKTVSYNHCYLHYNNSEWFFIDRDSKFGILKKIEKNYFIENFNFCNQFVIGNFCFEFHKFFMKRNCDKCDFVIEKKNFDLNDENENFNLSQRDFFSRCYIKNKNDSINDFSSNSDETEYFLMNENFKKIEEEKILEEEKDFLKEKKNDENSNNMNKKEDLDITIGDSKYVSKNNSFNFSIGSSIKVNTMMNTKGSNYYKFQQLN